MIDGPASNIRQCMRTTGDRSDQSDHLRAARRLRGELAREVEQTLQKHAQRPAQVRILLVEDYPDTLRILMRVLRALGYDVTPASTAHAAIELAAGERFDLLLSDIGLPDGSGLDVMRSIRQRWGEGVRGIAISGYGTDEDKRESHEAGFAHHLTKPLNVHTLETTIRLVVGL